MPQATGHRYETHFVFVPQASSLKSQASKGTRFGTNHLPRPATVLRCP